MPDLELSPMPTHCWVCGDALPGLAVEGIRNLIAGGFDPEVHLPPVYGTAFDTCGDKCCEGHARRYHLRAEGRCARCGGPADGRAQCADCTEQARLAKYGLTPDAYAELLAVQDGRCAICWYEFAPDLEKPHIDHDHRTADQRGRVAAEDVRGLLCGGCNLMLGGLERYADAAAAQMRAKAAALYLATPPASEGGRWLRGIAALSDADA